MLTFRVEGQSNGQFISTNSAFSPYVFDQLHDLLWGSNALDGDVGVLRFHTKHVLASVVSWSILAVVVTKNTDDISRSVRLSRSALQFYQSMALFRLLLPCSRTLTGVVSG